MSKEKQIDEMAKDVASTPIGTVKPDLTLTELGEVYENTFIMKIAKHLYNEGYRKQSEGEWIEASNKPYAACGKKCSLCGARISYREYGHGNHKYCHKCGAHMSRGKTDE
jgi:formamidopyrimidine-DNA glycosylase